MSIEKGSIVGRVDEKTVEPMRVIKVDKRSWLLTAEALSLGKNPYVVIIQKQDVNYVLPGFEKALGFDENANQPK